MTNKLLGAFFKVFICLQSFASLLNGKLDFIEILLTSTWDFYYMIHVVYVHDTCSLAWSREVCLPVFSNRALTRMTKNYHFSNSYTNIILDHNVLFVFLVHKAAELSC